MYFFINTQQDGPIVVALPPAVPGDAWYVPLTDIGFEGKGGKYIVLPPDYKGDVPYGYKFDETFFTSLSRTLNEEAVQPRDFQMMGMHREGQGVQARRRDRGRVEKSGSGSAGLVDG